MKRKALIRLRNEIQGYNAEKKHLEEECEKCDRKDNCAYCSKFRLFRLIDADINHTRREISELEWDVDTWSYTITGNKEAERISGKVTDIMIEYITNEERKIYHYEYPEDLIKEFFRRAFDKIVLYIFNENTRIAFQVLGWHILFYGARLPEELKELILLNSDWEDERDQLDSTKDREERKHWLMDFRNKIVNYKEGFRVKIFHETEASIFNKCQRDKHGFIIIDRQPIRD